MIQELSSRDWARWSGKANIVSAYTPNLIIGIASTAFERAAAISIRTLRQTCNLTSALLIYAVLATVILPFKHLDV